MKEWTTETRSIESNIPAIPYGTRDCATKNSQRYASSNTVQPPLHSLDLPDSENFSENREESQITEPLCTDGSTLETAPDAQNAQCTPYAPGTHKLTRENFGKPAKSFSDFICKDTITPGLVDCQFENVELRTSHLFCSVLIWIGTKYAKFKIFHVIIIAIDYS